MKYTFILFIVPLVIGCKFNPKNSAKETKEPLSNLVIVLSDQHSADMVGAYGNTQIITPNLDQLSREGILLENAFSSQPVCTPFRGMLMSGMHPLKNGAFVNDVPLLPNKTKLMAEILKEKGYQTAYFGKWHLLGGNRDRGVPKELSYGFDTVLTNNCHVDFRAGKSFFWNEKEEKEFFNEWEPYGQTRQAINYLKNIDPTKPFAIVLSLHPPHDWGKFKGVDGKMHYRYDTEKELMKLYNRDSIILRPGLEDTPDRRRMYHGHMAQVSGVDIALGRLMGQLKKMDIEENTLVAFSADHGDMLESHQAILPKQYPHDYSNKIPFIIKYPKKIKKGTKTKTLFGTMDILPTLLGYLDIDSKQKYDGRDLSKSLAKNEVKKDDFVPLWVYRLGHAKNINWRGVVTDDFTFSMDKDANPITNTLFDRKKDPHQLNNLYNHPEYKEIQEHLKGLTKQWMKRYKDNFYGAEDFRSVQPNEKWQYNYTKNPMELFEEKNK
ncbi:sulfatase-like hydrolase/transferase [Flavicella sediminum]|uniref:sulfatase-like hydrolase/transferase n=1 Tax=Flavicella sediminum TaxID=2585141 RepID=UPI001121F222|nr:sulfatase-like hydrolase/transferase [Flavicella sediminum]